MGNNVMYAFVGHFKMCPDSKKGITVYEYDDESARMTPLGGCAPEFNAGAQLYDPERGVLYLVDEYMSRPGQTGGGGSVAAFAFDHKTGKLAEINRRPSLSTNPSYLYMDKPGKRLLITHHSTESFVTLPEREQGGGYAAKTIYDGCALVVMKLEENGGIGEVCDARLIPGRDENGAHRFPHLHSAVADAGGERIVISDKGLDRIYVYAIDHATGRLARLSETAAKPGSEPRYGVFHPRLPIYYGNCESDDSVYAYGLDASSGALTPLGSYKMLYGEAPAGVKPSPSDIVMHPDGKWLYVSIRNINKLCVFGVDERGALEHSQCVDCGGRNPRGLCVSPSGRRLLVANTDSASVYGFSISPNGLLSPLGRLTEGGYPGNIQIVSF